MNLAELRKRLVDLTECDFDGHTRYGNLSPEQKLEWLSEAARFWWHGHGNPRSFYLKLRDVRVQADKRNRA
ncbi:MAG: hypothetical protein GF344_08910 [Chitinivibrionales bacterium]|nr:hypothetical protein [Chitinivibrionales bacterium]MBD3356978.1 hypothetical protein [Chitinivibrionales bacterium]